jgi:Trypsin-co-occurring domain 1
MTYLMEVPVADGGRLLVQVDADDLPAGLVPAASLRPGQVVVYAKETVESAFDQIRPAITAVAARLRAMAADEATVEFGLLLGAEGGAVVAKGRAEVHFTVTLTWNQAATASAGPAAAASGVTGPVPAAAPPSPAH